ncbi:unnamed protein product, partial [Polarella glacialis]
AKSSPAAAAKSSIGAAPTFPPAPVGAAPAPRGPPASPLYRPIGSPELKPKASVLSAAPGSMAPAGPPTLPPSPPILPPAAAAAPTRSEPVPAASQADSPKAKAQPPAYNPRVGAAPPGAPPVVPNGPAGPPPTAPPSAVPNGAEASSPEADSTLPTWDTWLCLGQLESAPIAPPTIVPEQEPVVLVEPEPLPDFFAIWNEVPDDIVWKPLSFAEKNILKARKKLREVEKIEEAMAMKGPGAKIEQSQLAKVQKKDSLEQELRLLEQRSRSQGGRTLQELEKAEKWRKTYDENEKASTTLQKVVRGHSTRRSLPGPEERAKVIEENRLRRKHFAARRIQKVARKMLRVCRLAREIREAKEKKAREEAAAKAREEAAAEAKVKAEAEAKVKAEAEAKAAAEAAAKAAADKVVADAAAAVAAAAVAVEAAAAAEAAVPD